MKRLVRFWRSSQNNIQREAMKLIGECGVPCGAVLDVSELYDDEDLNQRGIFKICNIQKG